MQLTKRQLARLAIVLAFAIAVGMTMTLSKTAKASPLERFQWHYRPLLVFAPSQENLDYQQQTSAISDNQLAFHERDMLHVAIVGDVVDLQQQASRSTTPPKATNHPWADSLRRHYNISRNTFTVILIGKDGGEKARWSSPVTMTEIFTRIDAMPMRQREIRSNRDD